jgi:hypothetical protein
VGFELWFDQIQIYIGFEVCFDQIQIYTISGLPTYNAPHQSLSSVHPQNDPAGAKTRLYL